MLCLTKLGKKKLTFECLSHLASYVAEQISKKRSKPFAYTTLNRNPVYRKQLQLFLGSNHKKQGMTLNERKHLEEDVYDMKIKLGAALEESRRLRNYIESMRQTEEQIRALPDVGGVEPWKEKFKQLILLTNALKEYFGSELTWDATKHSVRDDAYEREIISGDPVKTYDEYMASVSKFHGEFKG